jgi:hypothetical protein
VVLLFAIALFGIGLATVGRWESEIVQREREKELLRVGKQVMEAVRAYYRVSPGTVNMLPTRWDDLLEDRRFVGTVRHLRRVPLDPFSHQEDWNILRNAQGAMVGIASTALDEPLQRVPIQLGSLQLMPSAHYSEWHFVFDPTLESIAPAATRASTPGN